MLTSCARTAPASSISEMTDSSTLNMAFNLSGACPERLLNLDAVRAVPYESPAADNESMRLPFAVLVLAAGSCVAQDVARMDQIVQSYVSQRQFMGAALVARGSQVILNKGYGSANLEWDIANAPNT